MARPLVPDELWEVVQPLLPRHRARPGKRGRPPVDDRACLTGIIFVLQSGIPRASTGSTAAWTARPSALFLGGPDRQKPHGSRQKRHQTAPVGRWQGHAAGRADHCGQPQRVARSNELGGRHPADPRPARAAAAEAEGPVWGPGVRDQAEPGGAQAAAHRGPPGAATDAAWERLGPDPLGGGTVPGMGRASPPPEGPLR